MKLNLQHFSIRSTDALDSWIERELFALAQLRRIDAAHIRLARHSETSPAFSVRVHLETPGPDIVAEGSDHTIRAAAAKVFVELRERISSREEKRWQRVRSNLSSRPESLRHARAN